MSTPTPPDSTDDLLLAALRTGDRNAADAVTRRYWPAIHRFAASYLRDESLAEDVAQDTFARLTQIDLLPEGPLRPWLYKVARNRCLDILRKYQRSPTRHGRIRTGFDAAQQTAGPRTRAVREERRELIRQIIDNMPDEYRDVLMLKYFHQMSRAEIAAALETTEAAVKGRLARGSDYLQDELRKLTHPGGES